MKGQMEALLYGKGTDDVDGGGEHPSDIKHAHVQLHARRINCDENIQK